MKEQEIELQNSALIWKSYFIEKPLEIASVGALVCEFIKSSFYQV